VLRGIVGAQEVLIEVDDWVFAARCAGEVGGNLAHIGAVEQFGNVIGDPLKRPVEVGGGDLVKDLPQEGIGARHLVLGLVAVELGTRLAAQLALTIQS